MLFRCETIEKEASHIYMRGDNSPTFVWFQKTIAICCEKIHLFYPQRSTRRLRTRLVSFNRIYGKSAIRRDCAPHCPHFIPRALYFLRFASRGIADYRLYVRGTNLDGNSRREVSAVTPGKRIGNCRRRNHTLPSFLPRSVPCRTVSTPRLLPSIKDVHT